MICTICTLYRMIHEHLRYTDTIQNFLHTIWYVSVCIAYRTIVTTIETTHVKFISNTPALRKKKTTHPRVLSPQWTSRVYAYQHIYKAKHTFRTATKQTPAAKHFITLTRHSSNCTLSLSLSVYIICVWNVLSLDVYLMLKFDFLQFLYPNEEKFSNLKMVHGIYTKKNEKNMGLPFASLLQRFEEPWFHALPDRY